MLNMICVLDVKSLCLCYIYYIYNIIYIYIHILICVFSEPPERWAMLNDVCMLKPVLAKKIHCFPRKKGLLRRISFELHV